jgi:UPF0755 protein
MRLLKLLGILALVVVAAGAGLYAWATSYLASPVPLEEPVVFMVEQGSNLRAVARDLDARGVIEHPRLWFWAARLQGQASRIHAGEYEVRPGATPGTVLKQLVDGTVVLREFTVVEGSTWRDFRRALEQHPSVRQTLTGIPDEEVMERLGAPGVHPEGRFFPDTYRFAAGTTDMEILRQAYSQMKMRLEQAWKERAPDLPIDTPDEALTLASIVEKETALASERPRVAGVFARRLRLGMRLQSDPTVIYGLGEAYAGNIRRQHLRGDTPYNTYTRAGLPPTPIALPGEGALRAATQPDDTGAIYFVATGEPDGSHFFSATLSEHNAAVRRFLARMRERNSHAPRRDSTARQGPAPRD